MQEAIYQAQQSQQEVKDHGSLGRNEYGRAASSENLQVHLNPIALRMARPPKSFGHAECNRVKYTQVIPWFFCCTGR